MLRRAFWLLPLLVALALPMAGANAPADGGAVPAGKARRCDPEAGGCDASAVPSPKGPLLRAAVSPAPVVVLTVQGPIGPATSDFVERGLGHAQKEKAQLVVLQMDTPGGLDTSMRQIIKDILASPVPVATFVSPRGARAASAGTYILYASHVAAMAPGTNLGAATPVQIGGPSEPEKPQAPAPQPGKKNGNAQPAPAQGGKEPASSDTLKEKQIQDAAAYIRGLAQMRGRNAAWAERAVRQAASLSAEEALKLHVIDLMADDVPDLLKKLNGSKLSAAGQERILATKSAPVLHYEPDWRTRLLAVITDPSVAYILMLIGIYGLFFEFSNPGFVLPGVAGAICLLLALFAFQLLPINYAGLALVLLGLAFMIGEAFLPSFGTLGIGGVIAFTIGSIMLIDTEVPGYGIPWQLIASLAVVSGLFMVFVVGLALRARQRPVVTGAEELLGALGEMLEDGDGEGYARVHSETWKVRGQGKFTRGQKVRVVAVKGLTLEVVPVEPQ